jgi:hypothetical protein
MSERKRRAAAYRDSVAAVLAYIEGEDADLYNLLDGAARQDALATAFRLTYLAAGAVEELARLTGERPVDILGRLLEQKA